MAGVDGWKLLGSRINAERSRRIPRLTQKQLARMAGLHKRTIIALEKGDRSEYRRETIASVEAALGWEFGDAERVRRGLEPRLRYDPLTTQLLDLWPSAPVELQRMVVDMLERAIRPD